MDELTFRLWDTNVDAQEYEGAFYGESANIDEGRATGAWMCGFYLSKLFSTPEFREECKAFADQFLTELREDLDEPLRPSVGPAYCSITLRDIDIHSGTFSFGIGMTGHDETGYHCPTAAQLATFYIMSLIPTEDFRNECFETARQIVKDIEGAYIVNDPELRAEVE